MAKEQKYIPHLSDQILLSEKEYLAAEKRGRDRYWMEEFPKGKYYAYQRESVKRTQVAKVCHWLIHYALRDCYDKDAPLVVDNDGISELLEAAGDD